MKVLKIPRIIVKNKRELILVKTYSNYALYEDLEFGYKECFTYHELGMVKEFVKPLKSDLNVEKIKL